MEVFFVVQITVQYSIHTDSGLVITGSRSIVRYTSKLYAVSVTLSRGS